MTIEGANDSFEHAEHAAHQGTPFLLIVSVTIAVLAVLAASIGSLESLETAAALTEQNAASQLQNRTSDQWAFFQAKSKKKNAYEIAAKSGGAAAEEFSKEARRYDAESQSIKVDAQQLEHKVEERMHEAERHEHRHHILTMAATFLHVAIAITTIAIVTKGRRWPSLCGLTLSAAGVSTAVYAYL